MSIIHPHPQSHAKLPSIIPLSRNPQPPLPFLKPPHAAEKIMHGLHILRFCLEQAQCREPSHNVREDSVQLRIREIGANAGARAPTEGDEVSVELFAGFWVKPALWAEGARVGVDFWVPEDVVGGHADGGLWVEGFVSVECLKREGMGMGMGCRRKHLRRVG